MSYDINLKDDQPPGTNYNIDLSGNSSLKNMGFSYGRQQPQPQNLFPPSYNSAMMINATPQIMSNITHNVSNFVPSTLNSPLTNIYKNSYSETVDVSQHKNVPSRSPFTNGTDGTSPGTLLDSVSELLSTKFGIRPERVEEFRHWGVSTFKCTKQLMLQHFGNGVRTIDLDLESRIQSLKDTRTAYVQLLELTKIFTSHTYHAKEAQKRLADLFVELAQKSPELQEEFCLNAETQKAITKNMEQFVQALDFYISNVTTLVEKTMEDTLLTVKHYESVRLEFDAYRTELENLSKLDKVKPVTPGRLTEASRLYEASKDKFDKVRNDLSIKLKFLDENRIKVIRKQLILFHNAITAYYSGNSSAMDAVMKQFSISVTKKRSPNNQPLSWLENFKP